ncbi:MAG: molybdopterin-dependent oxidoreductase [Deltaproteobacteria bacterium]|nr:molybdopterin-dependent oxidoreductase [Deltaproteobacteria bacterium]
MTISRREFLKDAGIGSLLLFAWQSGLLSASELAGIEEAFARGEESWVTSVCQQCPGACGIRVRMIGSWPVSITGNSIHPINHKTLCPKGVAGLLSFYDPDRLRGPMRRVGERGEGKWEKITWEEALATVSKELKRLREAKETHKVAVMGGRYHGLMRTLFERFLEAYGSPNYLDNSFAPWQGPIEALEKTHGIRTEPKWDLERTRFLLSFSTPLLEAASSPVENLRGWANLRRGNVAHRGRVIQVESRLSTTAAKADEWVPIHPGTEGWLALGIIHVILKEDLYDGYYLGEHTAGFGQFKNLVLENYSHQIISELTGVPIDTIIRLAREFAATKPALAVSARLDPRDQIAIHTLNALVGSINIPGGVLIPREADTGQLPPVERDAIAFEGLGHGKFQWTARTLYPLEALFFYYTDPLFSNPQSGRLREIFAKIPLLVSFSPFLDETTAFCDLVLPDHTYLERWQDLPVSTIQGFPLVGLAAPVRPPLYETRHTGDLLLELSRLLGNPISKALPWKDFETALWERMRQLFESQKGDLFGTEFESTWTSFLSRGGWRSPSYGNLDEFQKMLREKGGWWDPVYFYEDWARVFRNNLGRFEFPGLKDLPTIPPGVQKDFPFSLISYPLMTMTGGRNANQSWLADIAGSHLQIGWKTWFELNPITAHQLKIDENDEIWVESSSGRIRGVARLYEGIDPAAVGVPVGFGHKGMGRWAKGIGANPRDIEEGDSRSTELPQPRMTRVKVYKV